jgi:hypothetical protein
MSAVAGIAPAAARDGWLRWVEARRWALVTAYLVLAAVALSPVFAVSVPPLVDYPNHLARMHILANWNADIALQRNYVIHWTLHPNMAMDLIVPLLARVMPIYMAGKVFVVASMLSVMGGTLALRKALVERVGLWPLLVFLVLYNAALSWGFLNFLFAAGLALGTFAGWIAMREGRRLPRFLLFPAAAFAIYVCHLFGLLIYGILVCGYEIWRWRAVPSSRGARFRELAAAGIQFILPAASFLFWVAGTRTGAAAVTNYGSLFAKFAALVSPITSDVLLVDTATVAYLVIVVVVCCAARAISLAPAIRLPALLLFLAALAMPNYLMGVWGTDLRLPTIVACLAIAGTRFGDGSGRLRTMLLGFGVLFVLIRAVAITNSWSAADRDFAEFRAEAAALPPGSRLIPLEDPADRPAGEFSGYLTRYWHMAALAVIERSVFLPTLFSGHTLIAAAPDVAYIDTPVGIPIDRDDLRLDADPASARSPLGHRSTSYMWDYWIGWPENFDYLLAIRFGNRGNPDPARLQPVAEGRIFDLYRIPAGGGRGP